jgi:uncharacterized protein
MNDFVGAIIDGLEFARGGRRLAGQVPLSALSRLADSLVDTTGTLDSELVGAQDDEGKCWLTLRLSGRLPVRCQRCLEAVMLPLAVTNRLLLVPPGKAWPDDELVEDGFDAVAAEKETALLPLIEDEVLLTLPIAPRHETCEPPAPLVDEHGPSPFAALAQIKKGA